ncbi:FTR1 family protein [Rhodopseudomonas sp. HC1]|uniref:FTR1 family iron permease n=1 Tax=Rhodopseudomonas infernalis TaxID=2897386 RepID=UPI001EE85E13|nr:FTR1 family protein [Rhodopseudomonas infernalis]MCG6204487.1 FTR1 family protein [Rhodopseudomonas infernalis]
MSNQSWNVAFVIWRESVEALLIIGILNAWLAQQPRAHAVRGRIYLWSGVVAGLVAAVAFGALLIGFGETLSDDVLQAYQTAAVLIAAALIVQMVFWMRAHGGSLKRELETSLQRAADRANWWGVFVLALIAVAREGSETVVFLYGTLAWARSDQLMTLIPVALFGFGLAIVTYYLLQVGSRLISWRIFFRTTEIMLLFLAASLLVTGVDNLVGLGVLPSLSGRLWDSSALLSDSGGAGGIIGALTGYRARPDLVHVLVYGLYWGLMCLILFWPRRGKAA